VRLIASSYPIFDIWRINRSESQKPNENIEAAAQTVLVTRPHFDVQVVGTEPDTACFIKELAEGKTVGAAYELVVAQFPAFDLTAAFSLLLTSGLFTEIREGN